MALLPRSLVVALAFAWCAGVSVLGGGFTSSGPSGVCQSLSSEFDFAKKPPGPAADLAFCKEYRAHTCCDKAATLNVLRQLGPLFAPGSEMASTFSDRCRQISSTIACAPCHPEVGTRQRTGICPAMCADWYAACADGMYTEVDGLLRPCVDSSLICAPLHSIVRTPAEFCERTGAGAGTLEPHRHMDEEIAELMQRDQREADKLASKSAAGSSDNADDGAEDADAEADVGQQVTCFDGTIPSGARAVGSSATGASTPEDGGAARKRYYKTAEEVADIERQRQKRRDQQTHREFDQNTLVQLGRTLLRSVQVLLHPLQRWYGRMVRKLPLPRVVVRYLDDPLALSIFILFATSLVWSVLQKLLARAARRCCRRGPPRARLETEALTSGGLSQEDMRALRIQALMQKAYADGAKESAAGSFMAHTPVHPTSGTYTAVIDGELVQIPQ